MIYEFIIMRKKNFFFFLRYFKIIYFLLEVSFEFLLLEVGTSTFCDELLEEASLSSPLSLSSDSDKSYSFKSSLKKIIII